MTIIGTGVSCTNEQLSLLEIVQKFCERTGLDVPETVMGNADPKIRQIRSLLEEEGKDLAKRGIWEGMVYEASLTTLAQEDQGAMADIATNNFDYILNQTIWDRSTRLPVLGPLAPVDYQALKALVSTGPRYRWRLRGGRLLVNPSPPAGSTWKFEYVTKNWILNVSGVGCEYFDLDTDTTVFPADLAILGLRWRWKKEKGLEYAEDFRTYEMQVKDALGRDGGKKWLRMDQDGWEPKPGVFIPEGSWSL